MTGARACDLPATLTVDMPVKVFVHRLDLIVRAANLGRAS